jgi:hypothetical protein
VGDLNWLAVVVAGVAGFFVGGIWYARPVFGNAWGRAAGLLDASNALTETGKIHAKRHPASAFLLGIPLSIVAAAALSWWLGPAPARDQAVLHGAVAGAAFVATSFGINYGFAGRTKALWLIDSGYHIAQFAVMGLVLGLWH